MKNEMVGLTILKGLTFTVLYGMEWELIASNDFVKEFGKFVKVIRIMFSSYYYFFRTKGEKEVLRYKTMKNRLTLLSCDSKASSDLLL